MSKKTQKTLLLGKMLLCALMLITFPTVVWASDSYAKNVVTADDEEPTLVYGTVVDKKDGEPLIGASVAIWVDGKLLTGTSTNIEGDFRIISQAKKFDVEISFIGFKPVKFSSTERKLEAMRIEL